MPMNPKPDLERTKFQIKHIYTQYKLYPAAAAFSRWISSLRLRKYSAVSIATISSWYSATSGTKQAKLLLKTTLTLIWMTNLSVNLKDYQHN